MLKVVSFDLFMTLVSLDGYWTLIWEAVLGRPVPPDEVQRRTLALRDAYLPFYYKLEKPPFVPMYEAYKRGFEACFAAEGLALDPGEASRVMLELHNTCPFYSGVGELLRRIAEKYCLIISSDADTAMVEGLLKRPEFAPCSHFFISEELGAYKLDADSRFFGEVLRRCKVAPDEVLHIGDARTDILGAHRSGIKTCHIRQGGSLAPEFQALADYDIGTLDELYAILNL